MKRRIESDDSIGKRASHHLVLSPDSLDSSKSSRHEKSFLVPPMPRRLALIATCEMSLQRRREPVFGSRRRACALFSSRGLSV